MPVGQEIHENMGTKSCLQYLRIIAAYGQASIKRPKSNVECTLYQEDPDSQITDVRYQLRQTSEAH